MISRGIAALVLLTALVACSGEKLTPAAQSPASTPSSDEPSSSAPAPSAPAPSAPVSTPAATPSLPAAPKAKDGQNYQACTDGTCQVLIRKKAALNLNGDKFTATVAKGTLKLTDAKGYISLSQNGSGASRSGGGSVGGVAGGLAGVSWRDAGRPAHTATLSYAEGDTVVVNLTTG